MAVSMGVWQRRRVDVRTLSTAAPADEPRLHRCLWITKRPLRAQALPHARVHRSHDRRTSTTTRTPPTGHGARQSIAVDAIVQVQPFKARAARSWANESDTLLDFDAATAQAPRRQSLRLSCQQHGCAVSSFRNVVDDCNHVRFAHSSFSLPTSCRRLWKSKSSFGNRQAKRGRPRECARRPESAERRLLPKELCEL